MIRINKNYHLVNSQTERISRSKKETNIHLENNTKSPDQSLSTWYQKNASYGIRMQPLYWLFFANGGCNSDENPSLTDHDHTSEATTEENSTNAVNITNQQTEIDLCPDDDGVQVLDQDSDAVLSMVS